jgi:serine/threonine-protein kinase
MLVKRLTEPPPSVRAARPAVPEAVDLAIRKALAPVPADRYSSAAEFARAIAAEGRYGTTAAREAETRVSPVVPDTEPRTATPPSRPTAIPAYRRSAVVLVLGILIGLGVLFAWRRGHTEGDTGDGSERRIAVLPFQNLGDSADAYFADGMTDAVRGKLTEVPGMRVIGSSSSAQYRGTTKTAQEIGRELGVEYLLVGKVRWQKGPSGASRVQVSPELIDTRTADARWQQPFDASLTDVFQVQADIAGRVAEALDVAIGSRQQQALASRPTRNLAAYDAYLKGRAQSAFGPGPANLRATIAYFEQAVALDSSFVAAWAGLAVSNALLYANGTPVPSVAERGRTAAERALALEPESPVGFWALGFYYVNTGSSERAVEPLRKGLALAPNDPDLLGSLGRAEQNLGRWDQAVEHLRRARSLDPRSPNALIALSTALLWLRRYDEAEEASDAALALQPSNLNLIELRAMVDLGRGDLDSARARLAQPPAGVDLPTFVAYIATYWDLFWVLDREQRAPVKRLTPTAFDGDAGSWGLALAGIYAVEGDHRRAAAYGDSARVAFEQQLYAAPENPQLHALLGVAQAYAGHRDAAIREAERAAAMDSAQTATAKYIRHQLARVYLMTGERGKALDQLEQLLAMPYYLSPGWLRIDPGFDPLRDEPRFLKLASGGAAAHDAP